MKYIDNYKIFENSFSVDQMSEEELKGKILHLYGSIPLVKQKSNLVIKKILYPNFLTIGDDVDLSYQLPHDKARFVDYFDSLLNSKDTRGDNFEGFLAGIYNGDLASPFAKYDIVVDGKTWSVKFVDNSNKAPELSSYQKPLVQQNLARFLSISKKASKGLKDVFKSKNKKLKEEIWNTVISPEITGGWLIAYSSKNKIRVNVIDVDTMKQLLMEGNTTSPKGGHKAIYSLAISSNYKNFVSKNGAYKTKHYDIIIPELTLDDYRNMYVSKDENDWSYKIFGKMGRKIRPDVLRYIKNNQEEIAQKLLTFEKFTNL